MTERKTIERKTSSMLQRVPVILAVTAASYGLQLPTHLAGRGGNQQGASTSVAASQPLPVARQQGKRQA